MRELRARFLGYVDRLRYLGRAGRPRLVGNAREIVLLPGAALHNCLSARERAARDTYGISDPRAYLSHRAFSTTRRATLITKRFRLASTSSSSRTSSSCRERDRRLRHRAVTETRDLPKWMLHMQ